MRDIEYNAPPHVVMADIIEANYITDKGKMRKEVMKDLKEVFGSVSPFNRAGTFTQLLNELDRRFIPYDKKQFQF